MKKISVLFIVLLLILCLFAGCTDNGEDNVQPRYFSFAAEPAAGEIPFELSGSSTVSIDFEVPETGYIKLLAFDSTEYVDWPNEIADFYVDFKDESGKILYENICISSGYVEKYKFDAGKVTAEITAENRPPKMERLSVSWAYAADNYEPVDIDYGYDSAAAADENGVARFKLYVNKASLVRIFPAEACIYESDCNFYVETADGERVTGDLSIHGTEWASRLVFLDKGEYIVAVSGIEAVASCKAKIEKNYTAIQLDDADGMTLPVIFGFNELNSGERTAKFTADGSEKYFVADTRGDGTFYDSVHYVDIVITDANGSVVAQSEEDDAVSDETRIDISSLKGEYTATISTGGSCVVELSMIE